MHDTLPAHKINRSCMNGLGLWTKGGRPHRFYVDL